MNIKSSGVIIFFIKISEVFSLFQFLQEFNICPSENFPNSYADSEY